MVQAPARWLPVASSLLQHASVSAQMVTDCIQEHGTRPECAIMTHDQQMTALRILCVNTHDVTGDVISAYLRLAREVAESASLEAD